MEMLAVTWISADKPSLVNKFVCGVSSASPAVSASSQDSAGTWKCGFALGKLTGSADLQSSLG